MTDKEYYRNIAFKILQKHHDYLEKQPSGNMDKPSEYNEDKILDAMAEYGDLVRSHEVNENRRNRPRL